MQTEPKYTLDELLADVTPDNLHSEVSTGHAIGKEVLGGGNEMSNTLSKDDLRDYIIRAHEMSDGSYRHPPDEMLRRINAMLWKAISQDSVMSSFLGYSDGKHDMLTGDGRLDDD